MRAPTRCDAGEIPAEQHDASGVCTKFAGDQVEQGRLAGAVRSDDQPPLAGLHRKVHRGRDAQAAERLVEIEQFERGHRPLSRRSTGVGCGRSSPIAQCQRRTEPGTNPSGMKMTMTTKIAPRTKFQRSM